MILLDTDHLSVLKYEMSPRCIRLRTRMDRSSDRQFATTIVNVEEQMRGWLASIHRQRDVHKQLTQDEQLAGLVDFFQDWELIQFDVRAADTFKSLQKQRVRIGTQDLKIASIALVQGALLLSANLRDFHKVSGLRVENWVD
jgi:tRNA(fMet)-specific endonuclease VapC